jgi:hypothetical protein
VDKIARRAMLPHPSERSERRKGEVAFKKENEPDRSPRHTSEFKREAYQRRESTIAATYLAKKFFTAVWPSNSFWLITDSGVVAKYRKMGATGWFQPVRCKPIPRDVLRASRRACTAHCE